MTKPPKEGATPKGGAGKAPKGRSEFAAGKGPGRQWRDGTKPDNKGPSKYGKGHK